MRQTTLVSMFAALALTLGLPAQAAERTREAPKSKARGTNAGSAAPTASGIAVKAVRVEENRSRDLVERAGRDSTPAPRLTVVIELQGKAVEAATHWGKLQIADATDNLGTSLIDDPGQGMSFRGDDLEELDREFMWFFEETKPKDRIRIDIELEAPPRKASMLQKVEGSLHLAATEYEDVLFAEPAKLVGKKLEDKRLEAAGVEATLVEFDPKGSTYAKLKGRKSDRLAEVNIVDGKGQKLDAGGSSFSFGDRWEAEISGSDPLPPDARLRFVLVKDRTEMKVPFRLEKIPLP